MKESLNTETFNIILDIPIKIELNKIHLVINGINYFLENHKNYINNGTINIRNNLLLNEIEKLPFGKYKNGDGRKIQRITNQYKICLSTVYQAQKLLRDAPNEILQKVRSGEMQIKTAYKLVKEYEKKIESNHSKTKRKRLIK